MQPKLNQDFLSFPNCDLLLKQLKYFLFIWVYSILWKQVSRLLLKYTKSGYETVLTAACARQGCSATE
jgi:hypothetical protein